MTTPEQHDSTDRAVMVLRAVLDDRASATTDTAALRRRVLTPHHRPAATRWVWPSLAVASAVAVLALVLALPQVLRPVSAPERPAAPVPSVSTAAPTPGQTTGTTEAPAPGATALRWGLTALPAGYSEASRTTTPGGASQQRVWQGPVGAGLFDPPTVTLSSYGPDDQRRAELEALIAAPPETALVGGVPYALQRGGTGSATLTWQVGEEVIQVEAYKGDDVVGIAQAAAASIVPETTASVSAPVVGGTVPPGLTVGTTIVFAFGRSVVYYGPTADPVTLDGQGAAISVSIDAAEPGVSTADAVTLQGATGSQVTYAGRSSVQVQLPDGRWLLVEGFSSRLSPADVLTLARTLEVQPAADLSWPAR